MTSTQYATRLTLRAIALMLASLCCALACRADSITLRPVLRVDPGTTAITLGQIATLDGPVAQSLADTEVAKLTPESGTWTTVDVAHVRELLKPKKDLDWSLLAIHGLSTQIRRLDPPKAPVSKEPEPEPEHADSGPNLRLAIVRRLTDIFAVDADHLRLKFDDRDEKTLALSTIGRVVDIQPLGSGDRIPISVHVYEGDKLVTTATLRVQIEILRHVAIATGALRRGEQLAASDFSTEDRWLPPSEQPVDPETAAGQAIRQRVNPGEIINQGDLQPPVVVKRGELVMVHCINSSFVVKLTARALSDGRNDEVIQFETLEPDRRQRRTLVARLSGPGTAIATSIGTDQAAPAAPAPKPGKSPTRVSVR